MLNPYDKILSPAFLVGSYGTRGILFDLSCDIF
jgi:hypothetical protein